VRDATATAPHAAARFAGALYAIVVVTGIFSLAYAPDRIFAGESDAAAVRSIVANEQLLRCSVVAELACYTAFVFLPLALYRLLAPYGQFSAATMAALAIVSVPFGFANIAHLLEILRLVDAGAAASEPIIAALDRYQAGFLLQNVPWGLWLIPLGILLIRSGFFPRILAILLIASGVLHVSGMVARLLIEERYAATGLSRVVSMFGMSEILTCLWLLVFGARRDLLPRRRKP